MKSILCLYLSISFVSVYLLSLAASLPSGAERAEATEEVPTNVKAKSELELRWSIRDPAMNWGDRIVHLEYVTRDWVQGGLVSYKFYDYDCRVELENPLGTSSLQPLGAEDGVQTWRLSLEIFENWRTEEKFCVRLMLHNLPLSNENSLEVNFSRSQLVVKLGERGITDVELVKPKDPTVQVNLPGNGPTMTNKNDEL